MSTFIEGRGSVRIAWLSADQTPHFSEDTHPDIKVYEVGLLTSLENEIGDLSWTISKICLATSGFDWIVWLIKLAKK